MYSSVYLSRRTSTIHYWEYDGDKKVYKKEPAPLYFYMKDPNGEYTSIYGDKLKKVEFKEFDRYKAAREMFKSAGHDLFESDIAIENRFILDKYSNIPTVIPKYNIFFIDIEVHSEGGFPYPEKAEHPIVLITVYCTKQKKYVIFAQKEFDTKFLPEGTIVKFFDNDEQKLLKSFIAFIRKQHPDFISGWNSNPFDIPYIINRGYNLLGEEETNKISPIHQVRKHTRMTRQHKIPYEVYQIMGINCLDYLELYRKCEQGDRESYKLDYIAEYELGEGKLKYEGSLKDLYLNDWQKYCEYNFVDVELLVKLDQHKKYFNLLFNICCNCKVPFEQFDKTIRVLDGAFISNLIKDKIILPDAKSVEEGENGEKYDGGFVYPTEAGSYDWVVSFDATSLYPSAMMLHNISPETKKFTVNRIAVEYVLDLLEGKTVDDKFKSMEAFNNKSVEDVAKIIKDNKYSIASNGVVYTHEKVGIVPKFVKEWFDKRQYHKTLEKKFKDEGNEEEEANNNLLQQNYKLLINSTYGYVGTRYSRMYDIENAEAVTITGQECIKTAISSIHDFFQNKWSISEVGKKLNAKSIPTIVRAGDTDSSYLDVGVILKSFNYKDIDDIPKCTEFIKNKIIPLLEKIMGPAVNNLTTVRMNAPKNTIFFKREMIARKAIFLKKKNYVAWVMDMEGKATKDIYDIKKALKAKGIEYIKAVNTKKIKDLMGEYIFSLVQNTTQESSDVKLKEVVRKFKKLEIEDVARVEGIKAFNKYMDENGNPIKGATGSSKSVAGYNQLLRKMDLLEKYDEILEGDKIKKIAIKDDCPFYKFPTIAFKDKLPKEFNLHEWVDYDIMCEKTLITPLARFYTALNWQLPSFDQEDISDLFY